MTGWLIYPKPEAEKNSWFIRNLIDYASKCDIDLKLKYAQDIAFGISTLCRDFIKNHLVGEFYHFSQECQDP